MESRPARSGANARKGGRPAWVGTAVLAAALLAGVGVLLVLWFARSSPPRAPDAITTELAHLKILGTALKLHAEEHNGKFPAAIDDIDWRLTQPGMGWDGLPAAVSRFHDPDTGELRNWIYYPGHTTADSPDSLLVASPVPLGEKKDVRLVVRLNGVAEVLTEGAFQLENKQAARS